MLLPLIWYDPIKLNLSEAETLRGLIKIGREMRSLHLHIFALSILATVKTRIFAASSCENLFNHQNLGTSAQIKVDQRRGTSIDLACNAILAYNADSVG